MPERGYLDFFENLCIFELTSPLLDEWVGWLAQRFPDHTTKTRHLIVNDFMGFAKWLKNRRDIAEELAKPELPRLEKRRPPVPSEDMLARYLAAIPEDIRGLWLIRSHDGLRRRSRGG